MKIAFLDIETTKLEADNGLGFILCASMKLAGDNPIYTTRIDSTPGYTNNLYNDTKVLDDIYDWLEKKSPSVVVHFNGDYFDIPYINTRRLGAGKKPLPPYRYIDHWKTSRYKLRLRSHSMIVLAEHLKCKFKKTYYSPEIWQKAAYGDKKSLNLIVHHCELDILILEEIHNKVMPILRSLKNIC